MDPNANLDLIVSHLEIGEIDEAEELAQAHLDWITRTGFLADDYTDLVRVGIATEIPINTHLPILISFGIRMRDAA